MYLKEEKVRNRWFKIRLSNSNNAGSWLNRYLINQKAFNKTK